MDKKLIFSFAIGGVVVAALYFTSKKKKTYATVGGSTEEPVEDETIKEKISKGAEKMVNWIMEHKEQIEAVTTGISFVTSLVCLKNALKPKQKKGMITLNENQLKSIINEKVERDVEELRDIRLQAVESFLDNAVYRGGRTMTRSDGVSVKLTVEGNAA